VGSPKHQRESAYSWGWFVKARRRTPAQGDIGGFFLRIAGQRLGDCISEGLSSRRAKTVSAEAHLARRPRNGATGQGTGRRAQAQNALATEQRAARLTDVDAGKASLSCSTSGIQLT
jgi:hypothetical protein